MSLPLRLMVTVVMMTVGIWAAFEASSFPITGRLMPLLGAIIVAVTAALHAIALSINLVQSRGSVSVSVEKIGKPAPKRSAALGEGHMQDLPAARRAVRYVLWLLLCLGLVALIGTWIGATLFLALFVFAELPRERRYFFVITAITIGVAAVLVFVLDIEVPQGWVIQPPR